MASNLHALPNTPMARATLRVNRPNPAAADRPADPPVTPPPVPGEYELLRVLGRGGMGVVYLARQRRLNRDVAYKVLTHLACADPDARDRFRSEAETLGKLQHTGIVQIFHCDTDGVAPFLTMEYVAGGSLAERLQAGRMGPREAATIVAGLAAAVGYAHAHGVIHRDLKPANILLTPDGRPKVADFGLARELAADHLTQTGLIAGTPAYMPPEQLTGTKDLTPAVDVWAMGVLLYEMLSGTVPFAGDSPQQILTNTLQHEPVPLRAWQPHLPRDLDTICRKCLHKDPHRRYPTGAELAEDLDRYLNGRTILARPVGRVEKGWRWCRRNPAVAVLAAGLVLTLSSATAVALEFAARANRQREEAEQLAAMMDGLIDKMGPTSDLRHELKAEMTAAADRLLAGGGDPLVRARLLCRLATTRRLLGDWNEAVPLGEAALALRLAHLPPDDERTCEAALEVGYGYCHLPGRGADAVRVLEPAVTATVARLSPDAPAAADALHKLALAYQLAGRTAEQTAILERLLAAAERKYGPNDAETEWRRVTLPRYALTAHNHKAAIAVLKKAYPVVEADARKRPENLDRFVWVRRHLGLLLYTVRKHRESLDYLRPAYDHALRFNGPDHPHVIADRGKLAEAYEECRLYADELPLRWKLFADYTAQRDLKKAAWQLFRVCRGLAWAYLPVTPRPA